jgi:2'-5' RNA ligase
VTARHARVRLFIAAEPPAEFLSALLARLGPLPDGWRAVPGGQHHLTVYFVGPVPRAEVARVEDTLRHAGAGIDPFELVARGLIALPGPPEPRVLAAELSGPPGLLELHRRLTVRLARSPRGRDRDRPHLTLARAVAGATPSPPAAVDLDGLSPWPVRAVRLVRSDLTPAGARYTLLAEAKLG